MTRYSPLAGTENASVFPCIISAFVITLVSSIYAVPLSWIPRVCVLSGDRKAVLYVDLIITSAKSVLYTLITKNSGLQGPFIIDEYANQGGKKYGCKYNNAVRIVSIDCHWANGIPSVSHHTGY